MILPARMHFGLRAKFALLTTPTTRAALGLSVLLASCSPEKPLPNYHSPTPSCSKIDFSTKLLNPQQLRTVVDCLNSGRELNEFNTLISSLSDEDLAIAAEVFNETTQSNASLLFALRAQYDRLYQDGRYVELQKVLAQLFPSPEKAKAAFALFSKIAAPIRQLISKSEFTLNLESLTHTLNSPAYRRLLDEHDPSHLKNLIDGLKAYRMSEGAVPISELVELLDHPEVSQVFQEILDQGPSGVQNLAFFMEWLTEGNRYRDFSLTIHQLQSTPISCFNNTVVLKNHFQTGVQDLKTRTVRSATELFQHDLKNLLLSSNGYCEIPSRVPLLVSFLDQASQQAGFREIYPLLHPFMDDPKFISFLESSATRRLIETLKPFTQTHALYDFLTLIAGTHQNSISSNPRAIAEFLDSTLLALSATELRSLVDWSRPVLLGKSESPEYTINLLRTIQAEFPIIPTKYSPQTRKQLGKLVERLIQNPHAASTVTLVRRLIYSGRLHSLTQTSIQLFQRYFEQGAFAIQWLSSTLAPLKQSHPHFWLPSKLKPKSESAPLACHALHLDWSFSKFEPKNSLAYFQQIELIRQCLNPNQTFQSLQDLALAAHGSSHLESLLSFQKNLISTAFSIDPELALDSFEVFLALDKAELREFKRVIHHSSKAVSAIRPHAEKTRAIRLALSELLEGHRVYRSAYEVIAAPEATPFPTSQATDFWQLKSMNFILGADETEKDVLLTTSLKKLFDRYCSSLNPSDRDCDLDEDQVLLYRKNPEALITLIKNEYLNSHQSWLHPHQTQTWSHAPQAPRTVNDLEFHINPALHLIHSKPKAVASIFTALNRSRDDQIELGKFLKERARRLSLIPYVYQHATFPESGKEEYVQKIRIRIVSDLDRLELIAINADFKSFGLLKNFGMGFIRSIGLSWGDVPEKHQPKSLKDILGSSSAPTLKETVASIRHTLTKFDKGILQKLGNCDPRGKTRVGRWIQNRFCSAEFSDISARLFNLRFLISLLEEELPESDGGSGGLIFLRNLFYSLYEANVSGDFDHFGNGTQLNPICLRSPNSKDGFSQDCSYDLLTLVPLATRLGILHLASLDILESDHSKQVMSLEVSRILHQLAENQNLGSRLSSLASQKSGVQFLESALQFSRESKKTNSSTLAPWVSVLSQQKSSHWMNGIIDLVESHPRLFTEFAPIIEGTLQKSESLAYALHALMGRQDSSTRALIQDLSSQYSPEIFSELSRLLSLNSADRKQLNQAAASLLDTDPMPSSAARHKIKSLSLNWLDSMSRQTAHRQRIVSLVKDDRIFQDFCTVFSDTSLMDQTASFIQEMNQNPDSHEFFKNTRRFLKNH